MERESELDDLQVGLPVLETDEKRLELHHRRLATTVHLEHPTEQAHGLLMLAKRLVANLGGALKNLHGPLCVGTRQTLVIHNGLEQANVLLPELLGLGHRLQSRLRERRARLSAKQRLIRLPGSSCIVQPLQLQLANPLQQLLPRRERLRRIELNVQHANQQLPAALGGVDGLEQQRGLRPLSVELDQPLQQPLHLRVLRGIGRETGHNLHRRGRVLQEVEVDRRQFKAQVYRCSTRRQADEVAEHCRQLHPIVGGAVESAQRLKRGQVGRDRLTQRAVSIDRRSLILALLVLQRRNPSQQHNAGLSLSKRRLVVEHAEQVVPTGEPGEQHLLPLQRVGLFGPRRQYLLVDRQRGRRVRKAEVEQFGPPHRHRQPRFAPRVVQVTERLAVNLGQRPIVAARLRGGVQIVEHRHHEFARDDSARKPVVGLRCIVHLPRDQAKLDQEVALCRLIGGVAQEHFAHTGQARLIAAALVDRGQQFSGTLIGVVDRQHPLERLGTTIHLVQPLREDLPELERELHLDVGLLDRANKPFQLAGILRPVVVAGVEELEPLPLLKLNGTLPDGLPRTRVRRLDLKQLLVDLERTLRLAKAIAKQLRQLEERQRLRGSLRRGSGLPLHNLGQAGEVLLPLVALLQRRQRLKIIRITVEHLAPERDRQLRLPRLGRSDIGRVAQVLDPLVVTEGPLCEHPLDSNQLLPLATLVVEVFQRGHSPLIRLIQLADLLKQLDGLGLVREPDEIELRQLPHCRDAIAVAIQRSNPLALHINQIRPATQRLQPAAELVEQRQVGRVQLRQRLVGRHDQHVLLELVAVDAQQLSQHRTTQRRLALRLVRMLLQQLRERLPLLTPTVDRLRQFARARVGLVGLEDTAKRVGNLVLGMKAQRQVGEFAIRLRLCGRAKPRKPLHEGGLRLAPVALHHRIDDLGVTLRRGTRATGNLCRTSAVSKRVEARHIKGSGPAAVGLRTVGIGELHLELAPDIPTAVECCQKLPRETELVVRQAEQVPRLSRQHIVARAISRQKVNDARTKPRRTLCAAVGNLPKIVDVGRHLVPAEREEAGRVERTGNSGRGAERSCHGGRCYGSRCHSCHHRLRRGRNQRWRNRRCQRCRCRRSRCRRSRCLRCRCRGSRQRGQHCSSRDRNISGQLCGERDRGRTGRIKCKRLGQLRTRRGGIREMGKLNLRNLRDESRLRSRNAGELRLGAQEGDNLLPVPRSRKEQPTATEGLSVRRVELGRTLEGRNGRLVVLLVRLEHAALRNRQATLGASRGNRCLRILKRTQHNVPVLRRLHARNHSLRKGRRVRRARKRLVEQRVCRSCVIQPEPRDVGRAGQQTGRG